MTNSSDPAPPLSGELVGRFMGALRRFARSFRQDFASLQAAQFDLDSPRFNVLQSIRSGHSYPKALAAHLHVPHTLLSRYLDQLNKQHLIERQIDPVDSRRMRLTPQGKQLTSEVIRIFMEHAAERLTHFDPAKLGELTELLEQFETLTSDPIAPSSSLHEPA